MPKKKIYIVDATATISVHVAVEASSKKEAIELAESTPMMDLCYSCAEGSARLVRHGSEPEWRTSGELDGAPEIITARVAKENE